MKSFIATLVLAAIFSSSVSHAQVMFPPVVPVPGEISVGAVVSSMKKGQIAPFTGVLLSPEAVAKIIVDYNNSRAQTEIELQKARETQKAEDKLLIDNLTADITREKSVADAQIKNKDEQLKIVSDTLAQIEKDKPNTTFWAGLGAVGGAAVALLTVFIVNISAK